MYTYMYICIYMYIYHDREDNVPHLALDALNIQAHFDSFTGFAVPENKIILVSDTSEESFYTVGEWSEYIAAFFNQEERVKGLADTALMRSLYISAACKFAHMYECVHTTAYNSNTCMYARTFVPHFSCTH